MFLARTDPDARVMAAAQEKSWIVFIVKSSEGESECKNRLAMDILSDNEGITRLL